nr:hypothetical protein CFP56_40273 [Quercus suber]
MNIKTFICIYEPLIDTGGNKLTYLWIKRFSILLPPPQKLPKYKQGWKVSLRLGASQRGPPLLNKQQCSTLYA